MNGPNLSQQTLLNAIAEAKPPITLGSLVQRFSYPVLDVAKMLGDIQRAGLLTYSLTEGYALTKEGKKAASGNATVKARTDEASIGNRLVGARMPAQLGSPNAGVPVDTRQKKQRDFAAQRDRTRDRLRQLAQESGLPQRRPLRSLRD